MKKASEYRYLEAFDIRIGRCERIRTFDPLHPMQVRYQAAPHTEALNYSLRQDRFSQISQANHESQRVPGALAATDHRLQPKTLNSKIQEQWNHLHQRLLRH